MTWGFGPDLWAALGPTALRPPAITRVEVAGTEALSAPAAMLFPWTQRGLGRSVVPSPGLQAARRLLSSIIACCAGETWSANVATYDARQRAT